MADKNDKNDKSKLSKDELKGVAGGAVYDALVGEAARVNGCRLLTRDQRAKRTYELLGVDHQILGMT